eukprot:TRINITY_DN2064_c0_g1_i1.p1 TRINITY_DN2064_c0_g1~~TRINITY_DN2064_c0_g1_i1.p1  ORF type:complete len:814 (+),score=124.57 TRINITY_DN2064_c0_g1_i1:2335-4776(+)
MLELARMTKEDQERTSQELEQLKGENEEYKSIIEQLEAKLGEIEKVVNDRNTYIQGQDSAILKLKQEVENKEQNLSLLRRNLEETLTDKDNEIENVKKLASNSIRSFYASLSQSTEPPSPVKDLETSLNRSTLKYSKMSSEKRKKAASELNIMDIIRPWMETITAECMKQIEAELDQRGEILKVIDAQNESLKGSELNTKKLKEKITQYHEGVRMRIEDLEAQLVESIRKNKMLMKVAKGYELTVEALDRQLSEYKTISDKFNDLLVARNQTFTSTTNELTTKSATEIADLTKQAEFALSKIASKKESQEIYVSELTLIKNNLEEEVNSLTERVKEASEELALAQGELSQIEQIIFSDSRPTIDEYMSKRVEEIYGTVWGLRDELDELQEAKEKGLRTEAKLEAVENANLGLREDLRRYKIELESGSRELAEYKQMLQVKEKECDEVQLKMERENKQHNEYVRKMEEAVNAAKSEHYSIKAKLEAELASQKDMHKKLKEDYAKLSAMHYKNEQDIDVTTKQLQDLMEENLRYREKLTLAENHIRNLESQMQDFHEENVELRNKLEINEKIYREEYEQYARANDELKNESEGLHIKIQELALNLQESENECQMLKADVERLKEEHTYEVQKLKEAEVEANTGKLSSSRITFGEESNLQKPEELATIKEKATKMPPSNRIEYYENIIEALIHKRQRTKRSCEKRIAEFEQILRLLEAAVQVAATSGRKRAQGKTKLAQMEGQLFDLIKSNTPLCKFLQDLLSILTQPTILSMPRFDTECYKDKGRSKIKKICRSQWLSMDTTTKCCSGLTALLPL